jgi:hypothetical protein
MSKIKRARQEAELGRRELMERERRWRESMGREKSYRLGHLGRRTNG